MRAYSGGLVCVEGVLGAKVVDAAGEVECVDYVLGNLSNPGDAAELPGCKAESGTLAYCFLEVDDKIVVVAHAGPRIVVHPGGAQGYAAAADLQRTLFSQKFMPSVVVFRSEWSILSK